MIKLFCGVERDSGYLGGVVMLLPVKFHDGFFVTGSRLGTHPLSGLSGSQSDRSPSFVASQNVLSTKSGELLVRLQIRLQKQSNKAAKEDAVCLSSAFLL